MSQISKRPNGYIIRLDGLVSLPEMQELSFRFLDECAGDAGPFVLVVDARTFTFFSADAQALFEELLENLMQQGLIRITVLAISTALANLFCNMMVRTEAMPLYQFLDLAYEEDFRTEMENWLNEPFENEPTP